MNKKIYTKERLLAECKDLLKRKGVSAFLFRNVDKRLYFRLYQNKIKLKQLHKLLNIEEELKNFKEENPYKYGDTYRERWTWEKIVAFVKPIVEKENFLPPSAWFAANGHHRIIQAIYNCGKTWDDLRTEFDSFQNSAFVTSRNGMRWRSHPEASFSNFLFARGIKHWKGSRYPKSFEEKTGQTHGYYDIEFKDRKDRTIQVEIWGDKPNGHAEEHYTYKRKLKEKFNKNNLCFLGVGFQDAYDEKQLEKILQPYIGKIAPFNFQKHYDKQIPTTHWSNADELIAYCEELVKTMPGKVFQTEEWLRKRGKHKNREGETYNTLSIYIKKWIGGIRNLRKILGQADNSTMSWDKEKAVHEFKKFYSKYNRTPHAFRDDCRKGLVKVSEEERKWAASLGHAINKYFGSTESLLKELNIQPTRRPRRRKTQPTT